MSEKCPKCYSELGFWTDDPILTLNGTKYTFDEEGNLIPERGYKGLVFLQDIHIEELQDDRNQWEQNQELTETEFTDIDVGKSFFHKEYINELRISTERLLGITDETSSEDRKSKLKNYFNYDALGNYIEVPGETDKEEWEDVDSENLPNLPTYITHINHTHI